MAKSTDVAAPESPNTALATLDEATRADLERAQREALGDNIELPRIKVAGQAMLLYNFPDFNTAIPEFTGVILGAHARNVLWTRDADEETDDPEAKRPACSSPDGKFGRPQEGFIHANLGRAATGNDLVKCSECAYNKFGTGQMFIASRKPKGKAVTNQKNVYIWLPDRALPFVLTLSSMAISGFDEYITKLTRRGMLMQQITTTFRQTEKGEGKNKYGIPTFHEGAPLGADAFAEVMQMRRDWLQKIEPAPYAQQATATATVDTTHEEEVPFTVEDAAKIPVEEKDGEVPF
jgi:hypothetical protein